MAHGYCCKRISSSSQSYIFGSKFSAGVCRASKAVDKDVLFFYQNVRGLKTKLKDFLCNAQAEDYSVISLTETWLDSDINSEEFLDSSYTVYRSDRNVNNSSKSRGGGVLLAVKNCIKSRKLDIANPSIEEIWILADLGDHVEYCLGCIYIPPAMDISVYEKHCDTIAKVCDLYKNVLIVGDFNLPNISWNPCEDLPGLYASNILFGKDSVFCDSVAFSGLSQFNGVANDYGTILDLCFSNFDIPFTTKCKGLVNPDSYHPPFELVLPCKKPKYLISPMSFCYDFKNADFTLINNYLLNCDWETIMLNTDLNANVANFYSVLYNCFDMFVPIKKSFFSSHYPVWFSKELKNIITQKKIAHKLYKQSGSPADYAKFSSLRLKANFLSKDCYSNYVGRAENAIKEDSRSFWKFIRSQSNGGSNIPGVMLLGDAKADSGFSIAELFAKHFSSVYNTSNQNASFVPDNDMNYRFNLVSEVVITPTDVETALSKVDVSKGAGPDQIPNRVLKECCHSLYLPLYRIFSDSLNRGVFPDNWKLSNVCPIFKSGNKNDVSNYRPISILSSIPKRFQQCVEAFLKKVFQEILVGQQHGFVGGRSVDTNLFIFTNFIFDSFHEGHEVHAIYTDFSKAFDKVNHSILIHQLSKLGITGSLLSWIKSYLSNREQQVKIGGCLSQCFKASSGVPQGSHLGPLLFILFINGLVLLLKSRCLLFADDLKIYRQICSPLDIEILQNDINKIFSWCQSNDMSLNVNKCCFMRFSRKRSLYPVEYLINKSTLKNVDLVKDLGVYLDPKLSFSHHFDHIISKANRMLGFVKRSCRDFSSIPAFKSLYISLVRSNLEFANVIWSPNYQINVNRIENVQHKFVKFMRFILSRSGIFLSNDQTMSYLSLNTLSSRREYYDVCFAFKVLNGIIRCSDCLALFSIHVPTYSTRNHLLLHVPFCRTTYCLYSPVNRISASVNKHAVNLDFFCCSLNSFKKSANRLILS